MQRPPQSSNALRAPEGGEIGFAVAGEGDWLVLIHGWCGSAAHWNALLPDLAADHRVLTVTLPGFGGMSAPPKQGRTIRAMAAAVSAVLDRVEAQNATLVGHSMGGPIATEVALSSSRPVAALLGLDTLSDRGYYGRQTPREIARRRRQFESDYSARMREMVDLIVHPSTPETIRQEIAAGMAATPAQFALDVKDDLFAWDAEARWPLVPCPALLLNSPHVARLADPAAMPCFAETEIAHYDSGHFPMIEAPALLLPVLRQCLSRLAYQARAI